jgi:hypothetical protein
MATGISSLHEVRAVKNWRACDPRRQHQLASELTGWLATTPAADPIAVTVVIPDETRPLRPGFILPPILGAIAEAGARRGTTINATILVATGLHRSPKADWLKELDLTLAPFRQDPAVRLERRVHSTSVPDAKKLPLHPLVMPRHLGGTADRVVTVGLVEPHQYAGFSGGSKALTIGCGSSLTINSLHCLNMLRADGVTIGCVSENPFRTEVDRLAGIFAAPTFTVALVPDPTSPGEMAGVFAGASDRPFNAAVKMAREILLAPVERQFDFALISVPATKSKSFYQASRALTYLALHQSPCVRRGGTLVLQARCIEGYGSGKGEQAFKQALSKGTRQLLEELVDPDKLEEDPPGGAQRAYVLAMAAAKYRCVLVGAEPLPEAQGSGLTQVADLSEVKLVGAGLVVNNPFVLMPYHKTHDRGEALDPLVELSDRSP